MVRVEVKNFQSIAHEVVEIDGFSAVVGRSNIGKSAVVRAIKAALTGAPAEGSVRHGELCLRIVKGNKSCQCFCSVHITAPGFDLLWEKGDAVNRYVYNATEHTVVGRGTPDIEGFEGFTPVQIGDKAELLQVSDQFNPIFILNKSGTVVADVLSDVAKLDEINVAMRLVEKDRKEAVATRKVRDKDILELRTALLYYDGFDAALVKVQAVEDLERQVEAAEQKLAKLDGFVGSAIEVARRIKALGQVGAINVPEIDPVAQGGTRYVALTAYHVELEDKQRAVSALDGVDRVTPPDIDGFLKLGGTHQKLVSWVSKIDTLRGFFDRTQKVATVQPPALDSVNEARVTYETVNALLERITAAVKVATDLKAALGVATQAEAEVLAEFKALGVCPTCNRTFTAAEHHQHEANL